MILAVDTCSKFVNCALMSDGEIIAESYYNMGLVHSEVLLPLIDELFCRTDTSPQSLNLLACTVGPGSFTGIRIGISTVKGIAQALSLPCVGVTALESQAFNLALTNSVIVSVIDARNYLLYNSCYRGGMGGLEVIWESKVSHIDEFEAMLGGFESIVFCGSACSVYKERLLDAAHGRGVIAPFNLSYSRASNVAALASVKQPSSFYNLSPVYLQKSQAEREFDRKSAE